MFIMKYSNYNLQPAVAKLYTSRVNNKVNTMYTVDIGMTGKELWKYFMKVGKSITDFIQPDTTEIALTGGDFYIKPVRDASGNVIKDNLGNTRYKIERDSNELYKNDIILFLEIPTRNFTSINYKLSGNAIELAKAYMGKERDDLIIKSPALVIEGTGDFEIRWNGVDMNGNAISDGLKYDYEEKTLKLIEEGE